MKEITQANVASKLFEEYIMAYNSMKHTNTPFDKSEWKMYVSPHVYEMFLRDNSTHTSYCYLTLEQLNVCGVGLEIEHSLDQNEFFMRRKQPMCETSGSRVISLEMTTEEAEKMYEILKFRLGK